MRALLVCAVLTSLFGCQRVDSDRAGALENQTGPQAGTHTAGSEPGTPYAKSDSINAPGAPNNIATPDATTPVAPPANESLAPPGSSGVEPSDTPPASTESAPPPDNSAINERDREPSARTPLDQGENAADRKTTAEIRQRIVNAENMSLNARNIKIITSDGRVTLRGPVNSAAEHDAVVRFARDVAGENNVEDQLEVAAADSAAAKNP